MIKRREMWPIQHLVVGLTQFHYLTVFDDYKTAGGNYKIKSKKRIGLKLPHSGTIISNICKFLLRSI